MRIVPGLLAVLLCLTGQGTAPAAGAARGGAAPDGGVPASAGPTPAAVRLVRVGAGPLRAAEVPIRAGTTQRRTSAYSLVAVTWRGADPRIQVRTRSQGRWSGWQRLETMADLGAGGPGVRGTEPLWVGRADGVRTRVAGSGFRGLELVLIDPGGDRVSSARPIAAARRAPAAGAPRPYLHGRRSWGAQERWRTGKPRYNRTLQQVHVHHTATGNDYRRREVPGLLRSFYRYHTHNLGWSDIGYNFLVDRFGRAWVGRAGGADRPVRGAHTLGFNATSVGIAVIGNFEEQAPHDDVVTMLVKLAAWKLDGYDRDPRGTVRVYSQGSDAYPAGRRVRLPVIDGHRDTNATACPGQLLYDLLPGIREAAGQRVDRFS